jgi:hypothetical protein
MIVAWVSCTRRVFDGIRFLHGLIHEDEFTTYKFLYRAGKVVVPPKAAVLLAEDSMGKGFKVK